MRNDYSLDMKVSSAYARLGKATRAQVRERVVLNNHAFRTAQIARDAKPRLVRTEPPARVLSLADFLSAAEQPVIDYVSVTLVTPAVVAFDKSAIVAASL